MADDTADLALSEAPELETASPEVETDDTEDLDLGLDGEEQETEQDEEELEDVEFDGKTHKLPKGLKEALMRNDDYTRKTQSVAEERRALEQQRARIAQQAQASEQELDARVAIRAIDKQIAAYENVDWRAWQQQDPSAAQAGAMELTQLREQRARGVHFVQQAEQTRTAEAAREFEERITETRQAAQKEIKGWTPKLDKDITDFAVGMGISPQYLSENINPLLYKVLHRAYLGDQALKRTSSVKPDSQKPPATATSTVKAKSSPRTVSDLNSMSMEQYAEHRKRQDAARAATRGR